jgi:hypothetical protein
MTTEIRRYSTDLKAGITTLGNNIQKGAGGLSTAFNKVTGFASALRSGNLPTGGESSNESRIIKASFTGATQKDWRVMLSLPKDQNFLSSPVLSPLIVAEALIFPYTPQISISHQASYQALEPVHNNYPFAAYENSKIDRITITADFYV